MLYQREPIIPIDVEVANSNNNELFEDQEFSYDFDEVTFSKTVQTMLDLRSK